MTTVAVVTAVVPVEVVYHPLSVYHVRATVAKVQIAVLYVTFFVAGEGVPPPLALNVATYCLGAEQESAVAGALEHVQLNVPAAEVTTEAVPTEQRFAVGGSVVAIASAVPHAGFCAHWA